METEYAVHDQEADRVGIEIRRNGSWRDTVSRYANLRGLNLSCLQRFDELINNGIAPPWAALRALDEHNCTDLIIDVQHVELEKLKNGH